MSDKPSWMPSDEEISTAFENDYYSAQDPLVKTYCPELKRLISTAVEKALAGRKSVQEILDTGGDWRELTDGEIEMLMRATMPDLLDDKLDAARDRLSRLIVTAHTHMTERRKAEKSLAEQEARQKREVIEARIEAIRTWGFCGDRDEHHCPTCHHVSVLRAELAALDAEVKP